VPRYVKILHACRKGTILPCSKRAKPEETPTLFIDEEIEWDYEKSPVSPSSLAESLRGLGSNTNVYRAFVPLGSASDVVIRAMERVNSPENEIDLTLWDWRLEVGPIECADLASEDAVYLVGWLAVGLSGPGYLFPWTFRDLVAHAEKSAGLQAVAAVCRSIWPIAPQVPDARRIEARRIMGRLWPYPIDAPVDWVWGLLES